MKILHLPFDIGGNAWALSRGERALGLQSDVLYLGSTWLNYPCDIDLRLDSLKNPLKKVWRLARAFATLRKRYDVFHFNYGATLVHSPRFGLCQAELPLYPADKAIFATYNGCDARQKLPTRARDPFSACAEEECGQGCCSGERDAFRRHAIRKMATRATFLFGLNPDLLRFLPPEKSSFLPYAVDVADQVKTHPDFTNKRLAIVHAPTNRVAKGSRYVIEAFQRLARTHGDFFEAVLVENVPHDQAMALFRQADLVVDQLLIGWYGAFAVEMMAMGKPVVCRLAEADLNLVPPTMADQARQSIIRADPATIHEVLVRCIEDRAMLREASRAGLEYARTWHDPRYVASLCAAHYSLGKPSSSEARP